MAAGIVSVHQIGADAVAHTKGSFVGQTGYHHTEPVQGTCQDRKGTMSAFPRFGTKFV